MGKLNAIEKSKHINDRYKEYLKSSFHFGNDKMQQLFMEQLDKENLFNGPYVNLSLPFQRGRNIAELIDEGIMSQRFYKLSDINYQRPLYAHQEQAIRQIDAGRGAIVTTGTGSGKTECFLYPVLNEILKEEDNGITGPGIRAIFLYPMNALVNDQIERVRKILVKYPDITYGFYTGDTEESVSKNYRLDKKEKENEDIPYNELVSRKEMRENPPQLLFTNYSMLEYLMIRPGDFELFRPELLKNWKFVVLDEAHSYSGSLGIELSLLMRRLTGLTENKPRFILTSATLGTEGKSENDIVAFAEHLTSTKYSIDDIIFSRRIPLNGSYAEYEVVGSDYCTLKNEIKEYDDIKEIINKYVESDGKDIPSILYDLLIRDKNVYSIYELLKKQSMTFSAILEDEHITLNEEELSALIDLINTAEKNGINIFDLKYHSFVRPLSGAYITLGKDQKLSLTKANQIDDMKAFELGNCRYCNSPYIIGKMQVNEEDGLTYLYQNKEVDIYENYGNNEFVKLDYFLLENSINEEEVQTDALEEYAVCSKCGCVYDAKNLNAKHCSCGSEFKVTIYRVKQEKNEENSFGMNNIKQCPCCGHRGTSGVVRGLNLGKDEGTALISQILYEAIDEGETEVRQKRKLTLKHKAASNEDKKEELSAKQFLAFSDSRQQASFYAVFFDSNHVRMTRKRLIWEVLKEHNFEALTVNEMVSYLNEKIKSLRIFTNKLDAFQNAWITVLIDLLKVDGSYDGEGLGLYYFDLDLSSIMDEFDEEDIAEEYGKYNITKADLENVIKVLFDVFKVTPAISYTKSTITPEDRKEYLEYRRFDNYVVYQKQQKSDEAYFRSFLPVNGKENYTVRYVEKAFGCSAEEAKEILDVIFNQLAVASYNNDPCEAIFKKHNNKEAYQINADKYVVRNYRKQKFYRCNKCGKLTPYNVHNVCVGDKCDGTLVECDPDEVFKYNFYRNEYKNMKLERITVQEHTAQIERKKAKEYQKQFKDKEINILSCSTTFEMGIDIGELENVFMRNVPPTPANYVQRAGRAGRRRDSSAYILTYCGTGSHDYTYFINPEKMIAGIIEPPYFNVINKKIIVRHLMATSLGFFFRKNPEYFKSINDFIFSDGIKVFEDYMKEHPYDLNEYINNKVIPGSKYEEFHDFKWFDNADESDLKLDFFEEDIKELDKEYEEACKSALEKENYKEADIFDKRRKSLHRESLIKLLSKYCVIPKYGFPVDVVELEVYDENGLRNRNNDLSRDLRIAISEYAPGSEVIVDKNKYSSGYISLPKTGALAKYYFYTCSECKKVNVFINNADTCTCKYCGKERDIEHVEHFIEPTEGFKTGPTKESARMKPKRSYAGDITYLGGGRKDENHVSIGDKIFIETSTEDELLVMNKSKFYMCPVCGYSEIINGGNVIPQRTKKHNNHRAYECGNQELEEIRLGHKFRTDVARLTIPALNMNVDDAHSKALSFMYAFLEGISNALEIDRNDIDGVLEMNRAEDSFDVLIYDNVPGGAGHVKRLLDGEAIHKVLKAALKKVSQECCDENTSCYNCLRNYYNQSYHGRLKRKYAKEYIELLLDDNDFTTKHIDNSGSASVGERRTDYHVVTDTRQESDREQIYEEFMEMANNDEQRDVIKEIIKIARLDNYECPRIDEGIELDESVWPDLFWAESKVAVFLPGNEDAYNRLKQYDWHCFMISAEMNANEIFENIMKEV